MAFKTSSCCSSHFILPSYSPPILVSNFRKTNVRSRVSYKPVVCGMHEHNFAKDVSSTPAHAQLHESDLNGCLKNRNSPGCISMEHEQRINVIIGELMLVTASDQEGDAVNGLQTKQSVYQKEFLHVTEWWKKLGLASELTQARHQPLKWYTWSLVALTDDTDFSWQRIDLLKFIALGYLIDDIFDIYGSLDELEILVEAVNKWDYAAIDTLPDYTKVWYRALLDTTNETALNIYNNHGYNPIDSIKAMWMSLCNAFLVEAKWFSSEDLPTADEYLQNGIVSSGVHILLVHLFYLLGFGGTKTNDTISLKDISELVSSLATIIRLWDDLGSAKDENQEAKDGSYIEYYRKDHLGVSVKQARDHVKGMISDEWERLNRECFHLNNGPGLHFSNACLNLARMVPIMYKYDDSENSSIPGN